MEEEKTAAEIDILAGMGLSAEEEAAAEKVLAIQRGKLARRQVRHRPFFASRRLSAPLAVSVCLCFCLSLSLPLASSRFLSLSLAVSRSLACLCLSLSAWCYPFVSVSPSLSRCVCLPLAPAVPSCWLG